MGDLFFGKKISYSKRGDKIEIRLMNSEWEVFFKKEVSLSDTKGIKKLLEDLKQYGLYLKRTDGRSWFD